MASSWSAKTMGYYSLGIALIAVLVAYMLPVRDEDAVSFGPEKS